MGLSLFVLLLEQWIIVSRLMNVCLKVSVWFWFQDFVFK